MKIEFETKFDIEDIVYFKRDDSSVQRAKIIGMEIIVPNPYVPGDRKPYVLYCCSSSKFLEKDLFRTAEEAFK